jgi:hypothetical protein
MMPTIEAKNIDEIARRRTATEALLHAAKTTADAARAEHAKALLSDAFPQHTLAVFTRNWDQDEPHLLQLISGAEGVDDLQVWEERDRLSPEQLHAVNQAEIAIVLIGADDDILEHLDRSDEFHEDWVEFDLPLAAREGR